LAHRIRVLLQIAVGHSKRNPAAKSNTRGVRISKVATGDQMTNSRLLLMD
jgi:hypothetical protein